MSGMSEEEEMDEKKKISERGRRRKDRCSLGVEWVSLRTKQEEVLRETELL